MQTLNAQPNSTSIKESNWWSICAPLPSLNISATIIRCLFCNLPGNFTSTTNINKPRTSVITPIPNSTELHSASMQACVALSADHFLTIEPDRPRQPVSIFLIKNEKREGSTAQGWFLCYILDNKICVFWFQPCVNRLLIGRKALSCQHSQGRFNDTTAQAQHQVQGGLLVRMTMAPWN